RPVWRAIAEIDHPRFFNAAISMSSSGVNIETGLLSLAGWSRNRQLREEPHPAGGWVQRVGNFGEQVWEASRERGHGQRTIASVTTSRAASGPTSTVAKRVNSAAWARYAA